ncbi:MAG: type II secretion system protein [Cyanobacteriota bacterium]
MGKKTKGFTLIELMIIIVIIGVLVSIAITNFYSAITRAREASVKNNMKLLQTATETYGVDSGAFYPQSYYELKQDGINKKYWKDFNNPFTGTTDLGLDIDNSLPPNNITNGIQGGSLRSPISPNGAGGATSIFMQKGTVLYMSGVRTDPVSLSKYTIYGVGNCNGLAYNKLSLLMNKDDVFFLSNN